MLHPATVHFAMVLPVVASVFGVIYLVTKSEGMSKISARSAFVAALAMIGVWYTGSQAGPQIYDYLSQEGQATLIAHKNLGLYLAIAMSIIALVQMAGCKMQKFLIQAVGIVALLVATATTLYQGKMGGQIVYNYGMPFKSYMIMDSLQEATNNAADTEEDDEKVEAYEDAIDDIKMLDEEVNGLYGVKKAATKEDEE